MKVKSRASARAAACIMAGLAVLVPRPADTQQAISIGEAVERALGCGPQMLQQDQAVDNAAPSECSVGVATIDFGEGAVSDLIIRTEGLKKDYVLGAETVRAVRGVDLKIREGEFVAIMGPSGSGKSTFMNMIGCLDTPTAGKYWLSDQLVSELTDDQLARVRNQRIGFVFQTFNLLPRATALHNVELPLIYAGMRGKERRERAAAKLELVGLSDRMNHKPPELSGGQRQRVAVARALVNEPDLLLADEPTGNLDSVTSSAIMRQLTELNEQGQTILLVTHEHDIAEYSRRQVHLKDGLIEQDFERVEATV